MDLELLLLPALGGYWLITNSNQFRFKLARETGNRLFFASAIAGIVLFSVARLIAVLAYPCVTEDWKETWNAYAPFAHSGTVAIGAILAVLLPYLLNQFEDERTAAKKAAKASGDLVECVLQAAAENGTLVEVSLSNNKSYVGWVQESGVDARDECDVSLIPLMSGYRDSATRTLILTTNYAQVFSQWQEAWEKFTIVFPMSEIVLARHFEPGAYVKFLKQRTSSPS